MKALRGFNEEFGVNLEKRYYMDCVMRKTSERFGYQEIDLPILEHADAYGEDLIGKSPWPGWNKNGCFFFPITNYENSYDEGTQQNVVLIPEGTVSVTRWLAEQMERDESSIFPLKLFYSLNCYRNELLSSITDTRRREFKQFGLELLGTCSPQADEEILYITAEILSALGVKKNQIRIRLNDIRIFSELASECGLSDQDVLTIKSLLDRVANMRVRRMNGELSGTKASIYRLLDSYSLSVEQKKCWNALIEHRDYCLTGVSEFFPDRYSHYFRLLREFRTVFQKIGVEVALDPCVIRSHEYYTGISFEVDVVTDQKEYIEIAGGGRYDRLVGKFFTRKTNRSVPCTGFAFGTERVCKLMNEMGLFHSNTRFSRSFYFKDHPQELQLDSTSLDSYLEAALSVQQDPVNILFCQEAL